jgi:endonuclease YncB( thermonuclease family)
LRAVAGLRTGRRSSIDKEPYRCGSARTCPLSGVTVDRYGRQVAVVWAGRVNLSCWQLQRAQAIYKPNWDNGQIIARAFR